MKKIYIAPKSIMLDVDTEEMMQVTTMSFDVQSDFGDVISPYTHSQRPKDDDKNGSSNNFMGRNRGNSIWGDD